MNPDFPVVRSEQFFRVAPIIGGSRRIEWRGRAMKLNLPIEMLVSGSDDVRLFLYIVIIMRVYSLQGIYGVE